MERMKNTLNFERPDAADDLITNHHLVVWPGMPRPTVVVNLNKAAAYKRLT